MPRSIHHLTREDLHHGLVQVSLDLTTIDEALATATTAVESGVDWLEVGTPLVMAEGAHAVRQLRREFPDTPLVVDVKIMDGGFGETSLFAEAGADAVVVMGRAHDATIEAVCRAAGEHGLLVMGDDMGADDPVAEARRLERLGVGMVLHHIGHDHRSKHRELDLSPLTDLASIVEATSVPVQAVGGLTLQQALGCPALGAGVVVLGAPLVINDEIGFTVTETDLSQILTEAVAAVHTSPVSKSRTATEHGSAAGLGDT